MTRASTLASSIDSQVVIPAELLDALVEAVVFSPDPQARSAVIRSLVREMCAAVEWLHGGATLDDVVDVELAEHRPVGRGCAGSSLADESPRRRGGRE